MTYNVDPQHDHASRRLNNLLRRQSLVATVAAAASLGCVGTAVAQSNDLGAYKGTIKVSGTEIDPQVSYNATVEISLPVTERDDDLITAEFLTGEAPNATVKVLQWDEAHTEKSPGADGKLASYTCHLAAPKEIPMTPSGVVNVDLAQSTYSLSITLLGLVEVDLNCVHSHSGPYKEKHGMMLYIGTGTPGMQEENPQPFTDADHLAAKFTLVPGTQGQNIGPVVQEWDLRLAK